MRNFKSLILAGVFALGACTQVNTGYRGVETVYGRVDGAPLTEGLYWYNPWSTDIIQMNVQQQHWGDKTETYTKDVQKADITFVMNYHLDPNKAHVMYSRVGTDWAANIIPQATQQTIKNEFGRVEAVAAVEHRGEIADSIESKLRTVLAKQNIILDSFDLTNISYTGAFEQAVEAKQVAVQRAIQAQNHTVEVTENGKQTVIAANANAEALRVTSAALEANPKLIEYEAIKKWDGTVPQTMAGNGTPYSFMIGNK